MDKKTIPPFDTYYIITGDDEEKETCLGRLVDAFKNLRLLVWDASQTPDLIGVQSKEDLIVAPHRASRVSSSYLYYRMSDSGWHLGLSMGGISAPTWEDYRDKETDTEFLIVHDEGLIDPCQVCVHAVERLSGECSPMGPKCVSRGDKKWI